MKQFEYEYRVVRPGCNYPTYTDFLNRMCTCALMLSPCHIMLTTLFMTVKTRSIISV